MHSDSPDCVGAVLVEKFGPDEVQPGVAFEYEIRLSNPSNRTVESILLVESLLSWIRIEASQPPSRSDDPHVGRWLLGPVLPRTTTCVRVRCRAGKALRFRTYTSISYSLES